MKNLLRAIFVLLALPTLALGVNYPYGQIDLSGMPGVKQVGEGIDYLDSLNIIKTKRELEQAKASLPALQKEVDDMLSYRNSLKPGEQPYGRFNQQFGRRNAALNQAKARVQFLEDKLAKGRARLGTAAVATGAAAVVATVGSIATKKYLDRKAQ